MAKPFMQNRISRSIRTAVPVCGAACLFCLTAYGADVTVKGYTFEAPPPEYDFTPKRPYTVKHIDKQLMGIFCGNHPGRVVLGCTLDDGKRPVVFVLEGLDPEVESEVMRHELAHVNGWEHE